MKSQIYNCTHQTSFIKNLSLSLYQPQIKSSWKDSPSFLHVLLKRFESGSQLLVLCSVFVPGIPALVANIVVSFIDTAFATWRCGECWQQVNEVLQNPFKPLSYGNSTVQIHFTPVWWISLTCHVYHPSRILGSLQQQLTTTHNHLTTQQQHPSHLEALLLLWAQER